MIALFLTGCASGVYRREGVTKLPPEEYLQRLAATENAYLLDIRTPPEYRRDHLEGAQNINFISFSFGRRLDELDPARPVFIYCHTAHRSPYVARALHRRGFRRIVDLAGGFRALRRAKVTSE